MFSIVALAVGFGIEQNHHFSNEVCKFVLGSILNEVFDISESYSIDPVGLHPSIAVLKSVTAEELIAQFGISFRSDFLLYCIATDESLVAINPTVHILQIQAIPTLEH